MASVSVYPWTSGTGFGTRYADPATLPGTNGFSVAFSTDGNDIAVGYDTSPFVSVYPWTSGTGFGAKYADPATLPAGTVLFIDWLAGAAAAAKDYLYYARQRVMAA